MVKKLLVSIAVIILLLLPFYSINVNKSSDVSKLYMVEEASPIEEFKENHRKIITSLKPAKFVYVVPPYAGYGNQLIQIINAFVVALITDSAVVLNNMTHLSHFVEEPLFNCFQTNQASSNELSYLYQYNQTYLVPASTENTLKPNKNVSSLMLDLPTNYSRFVIQSALSVYFEIASNRNYYEKFLRYRLVKLETIQKARKMWNIIDQLEIKNLPLGMNDIAIDVLYQTGFELAHNIIKHFWKPKKFILKKAAKFEAKHFKGFFVIGVQIRTEFLDLEDLSMFIKCAHKIEKEIVRIDKPVKWYISCDNPKRLDELVRQYPNKIIHANGKIGHVVYDLSAYERVFLDIELLSRCDELILTGYSTFGFTSMNH